MREASLIAESLPALVVCIERACGLINSLFAAGVCGTKCEPGRTEVCKISWAWPSAKTSMPKIDRISTLCFLWFDRYEDGVCDGDRGKFRKTVLRLVRTSRKDIVPCIPPAPSAHPTRLKPLAQTTRTLHSHVPPPVPLNTTFPHHPQAQPNVWFPWRLKTSTIPSIILSL
ncbi:hypothetical protein BKA63DRAFT_300907 [Paraphoma chrysanthemicola]|nr:hypothetical protein BKA63DRAFT_300907 [Paraphoma chrysanthemicola]